VPAPGRPTLVHLVCVLAFAMLLFGAGCGNDDDDQGGGGGDKQAQAAEKAFLTAMVHHHESALDMARIAEDNGKDPFIKGLAEDIRTTQVREIAEMKRIHKARFGTTLQPDPKGHDGLGLSAAEAGMTHSAAMNEQLRSADPFDRAFVDEMVPHHRGAVRMADVVLAKTQDASIRRLAQSIATTQKREIREMNDFRTKEFGGPVPAGARHGMHPEKPPAGKEEPRGHHPG
jgi:uncharacterized protein (DUF305 family)